MRRSVLLYQQKSWLSRFESIWNERTGVSEITLLKESVAECSQNLDLANQELDQAKQYLEKSWNESTMLQREHSELLRNRDVWTPDDATRFSELLQREITLRDDLAKAKSRAKSAENTVASLRLDYMDRLRRRYQEEQVWQDKWRILGTYGTWGLILLNSLVFGMSQILYQRRELARMRQIENLLDERLPKQPKTRKPANEQPDQEESESEQKICLIEANVLEGQGKESCENARSSSNEDDSEDSATFWTIQWWMQRMKRASTSSNDAPYSRLRNSFHPPSAAIGASVACLLFTIFFRN